MEKSAFKDKGAFALVHFTAGGDVTIESACVDCPGDMVFFSLFFWLTSILWNELLDVAGNVLVELQFS